MNPVLLIIVYGITILGSAVAGGYLPSLVRMTHVRVQMILSFVGGLMLGVAVLHLLPHSVEMLGNVEHAMLAMLAGLLVTFFMMRAFQFHQHCDESHGDHHGHGDHKHEHHKPSKLGWLGVVFGLAVHTFIDGIALGAAVVEGSTHPSSLSIGSLTIMLPAGLAIYFAILLHKPLDAVSVSSLMQAKGLSWKKIQAANAFIALMVTLGALAVAMFGQNSGEDSERLLGWLLAASAGVFLCISLSDLLPEVQFHQHDKLQLSGALLLGIALAFGMESLHTHPDEGPAKYHQIDSKASGE